MHWCNRKETLMLTITITGQTIISVAGMIGAFVTIFAAIFSVYRWYLRQNAQDNDIKSLKERMDSEIKGLKQEQCLIVYGLLACLKGLKEQGCNGPVTKAVDKLEKHINKTAHDVEERED